MDARTRESVDLQQVHQRAVLEDRRGPGTAQAAANSESRAMASGRIEFDVFLNGLLMQPGDNNDYEIVENHLRFDTKLRTGDTICVVRYVDGVRDQKLFAHTIENHGAWVWLHFDQASGEIHEGLAADAPADMKIDDSRKRLG